MTYTATDAASNTATCSFTVTVTDATAPVIAGCPANISLSAGASCNAVATWTAPTVSDNCSGSSIAQTAGLASGAAFPLGTTTVTYTATDAASNTATCSFTVTVTDATAPVIAGCPANISLSAGGSCNAVATWTAPTVSDNCSGSSIAQTAGLASGAAPLGTTSGKPPTPLPTRPAIPPLAHSLSPSPTPPHR
ncbi:MAG: HYR domain-containing protein [Flavobacteriales bacterium]|nr:HYR domain-containing protein [Flavobacteriales bacterium]